MVSCFLLPPRDRVRDRQLGAGSAGQVWQFSEHGLEVKQIRVQSLALTSYLTM